jgi:hypothetical protein
MAARAVALQKRTLELQCPCRLYSSCKRLARLSPLRRTGVRGCSPCGGRVCAYIVWYDNINYEMGSYEKHTSRGVVAYGGSRAELPGGEVPIHELVEPGVDVIRTAVLVI